MTPILTNLSQQLLALIGGPSSQYHQPVDLSTRVQHCAVMNHRRNFDSISRKGRLGLLEASMNGMEVLLYRSGKHHDGVALRLRAFVTLWSFHAWVAVIHIKKSRV